MKITELTKAVTILESCEEEKHDRIVQKHIDFYGMPVCVEIVAGGVKHSRNKKTGKPWTKTLQVDYGYFDGITGNDGDYVDCYIGPGLDNPECKIFIINQMKPDGSDFDEHKVMIGYKTAEEAKESFLNHCHTPECFGSIKEYTIDKFREFLKKEGEINVSQ